MMWVRLDDQFRDHPKVVEAGPLAGWLFVCGLCYAGQYLTDGFIPSAQVRRLADLDAPDALAARLVAAGLWETVDGGYQIHDFLDFNPTAAKVRAEREAARVRMERRRTSAEPDAHSPYINEANFEESSAEVPANNARSSASPSPYPDPGPEPLPDPAPADQPFPSAQASQQRAGAGARTAPTPVTRVRASDAAQTFAAAPPTDAEQELLVAVRGLPKWPKEREHGADLAKLRLWRKVYPDRLTLAELSAMASWLESHRQRSGNYQFVENWLKRPSQQNGAHRDHVQASGRDPTTGIPHGDAGWAFLAARKPPARDPPLLPDV